MSDSDLREFKAALEALESAEPGRGPQRFRLLRRTLTLAMKCAAADTNDPAVWRTLGEFELMRHEKYRQRSRDGEPQARKWLSRVAASFDRASAYLGRAFLAGDESTRSYLSYLYAERAGLPEEAKPREGHKPFFDPFAEDSYAFRAMRDVFEKTDRPDLVLSVLRRAGIKGHIWALLDLAALLHNHADMDRQVEAVTALVQAKVLLRGNPDPVLRARLHFLMGLCEYHGYGGMPENREGGMKRIVESRELCEEARVWLFGPSSALPARKPKETPPAAGQDSVVSPLRFFSKSYDRLEQAGRYAAAALEGRSEEEILAPLDALIGLPALKDEAARLVHLGRLQELRLQNGLKPIPLSLHMAFLGDPGTGKTMAARLIGQVMKDAGLLKKGHLVETDRAGLVGEYIGQTEKQTKAKLNEALGGVLFIDEAYALGNTDSSRDFGRYAIETILKFMEDRRSELMVIVAGYTGPMKTFFASNPGLRSRFTRQFEFPSIEGETAAQMFENFADEYQYVFAEGVREEIARYLSQAARQGGFFNANGRGVRTLFEQAISRQARRVVRNRLHHKDEILYLHMEDLPWDTGRSRLQVVRTDERGA